ncbi:protein yellow-like [Sitodiplosis mosellana]|uniref:protein yellow-like n=1 Tax=Sitodiplosis mosellana TaxID=263140 RepID=UPI002443BB74|nr:protein yellow-like [Sitodiplosis mosellana]XP_055316183.1 protein yellow-like [Sitodiplosis mosellana]XP_055316184.1 protein yellow-like [Sitodiplosis mosellana]XP_055316185.1 protein yellow-like [Sitodiplosis mosellana]
MRLTPIGVIICVISINEIAGVYDSSRNLKVVAEWDSLDYVFPQPHLRQQAIQNGQFVRNNGVPIDVDVDYQENLPSRIFVTIPRFTTGIPVTLGYVAGPGNLIQPYPSYSWHESHGRDCDGITSVFRIAIDKCRRLWVLDTGRIGAQQYCQPQILVFNLNTDTLIHRYRFPQDQYKPGVSLFITPVLDVQDPPPGGECLNTKAYIADVTGFGLIVYDARANRSWRVQNKLFYPTPCFGTHTVAGESFDLMDGLFGLALTPVYTRGYRHLYFHALASNTENSVRLDVLNNATAWQNNVESSPREFREIGQREVQATAEAMDSNGNLFFGLERPSAIACWDSEKPYTRENMKIAVQNDNTLQFVSGLKVIVNRKGKEELWAMSCRFQKIMTGSINPQEINFRIQALQVDELLGGRKCTPSRPY